MRHSDMNSTLWYLQSIDTHRKDAIRRIATTVPDELPQTVGVRTSASNRLPNSSKFTVLKSPYSATLHPITLLTTHAGWSHSRPCPNPFWKLTFSPRKRTSVEARLLILMRREVMGPRHARMRSRGGISERRPAWGRGSHSCCVRPPFWESPSSAASSRDAETPLCRAEGTRTLRRVSMPASATRPGRRRTSVRTTSRL